MKSRTCTDYCGWVSTPPHQHQCSYCNKGATAHFIGNDEYPSRYLCRDHYTMHFEGDPWLELVEIVREAENA